MDHFALEIHGAARGLAPNHATKGTREPVACLLAAKLQLRPLCSQMLFYMHFLHGGFEHLP